MKTALLIAALYSANLAAWEQHAQPSDPLVDYDVVQQDVGGMTFYSGTVGGRQLDYTRQHFGNMSFGSGTIDGRPISCTTMDLGNGFRTTDCN